MPEYLGRDTIESVMRDFEQRLRTLETVARVPSMSLGGGFLADEVDVTGITDSDTFTDTLTTGGGGETGPEVEVTIPAGSLGRILVWFSAYADPASINNSAEMAFTLEGPPGADVPTTTDDGFRVGSAQLASRLVPVEGLAPGVWTVKAVYRSDFIGSPEDAAFSSRRLVVITF